MEHQVSDSCSASPFREAPILASVFESLFAGLLSVGGLVMVIVAARWFRLRSQMKRWPRVSGVVEKAEVIVSRGRRRSFRPEITVAYTFGDRNFVTNRFDPAKAGFSDRRPAEEIVSGYPTGATVEVFVHPDDPTLAYLRRNSLHLAPALLLGGTLLLFAGVAGVLASSGVPLSGEMVMPVLFLGIAGLLMAFAVTAGIELLRPRK